MLVVNKIDEALPHFLNFHFYRLGKMLIWVMTGNPKHKSGVGKSYTAIRIGELIDEDFTDGTKAMIKIVHTPDDFIKAMEYIEQKGKRGQVLIIDEAALLVNARQWHSLINKAVSDVTMTFRTLKCLAIFVTPTLGSIDKNIRLYTNLWSQSEKTLKNGYPVVRMKLYQLMWDMMDNNKFYRRRIAMFVREMGKVCMFRDFWIDMPHNKELIDAYEEKALKFKREVRQSISDMGGSHLALDEYIDEIKKAQDLIHESRGKPRVYAEEIRNYFAISKDKSLIVARKANEILRRGEPDGSG